MLHYYCTALPLHYTAIALHDDLASNCDLGSNRCHHGCACFAGHETPLLAKVAKRVTSMTSSAGACERNWTSYDFIHSKKRNKLSPQRANDLVFVFTNLRLMARFNQPEKFAEWVEEIDEEQQLALLGLADDEEFESDTQL